MLKAYSSTGFNSKSTTPLYRASGHISENLTYSHTKNTQLTFEDYEIDEQRSNGTEIERYIGIKLSSGVDALRNTLERLLFEKKIDQENIGNELPEVINYRGKEYFCPRLSIGLFELAREHYQKKKPSGRELIVLRDNLSKLVKTSYKLIFTKDGKKWIWESPLIRDLLVEQPEKDNKLDRACVLIRVHPLFGLDINNKFVLKPTDINQRIREASGANNPPEAIRALVEYLYFIRTNKRTKKSGEHIIGKDKLIEKLGLSKLVDQGKRKVVQNKLLEAFDACKHPRLLLLKEVEEITSQFGVPQYKFTVLLPTKEETSQKETSQEETKDLVR